MQHIYIIRESKGVITETDLPGAAHLIDQGKLKYTGRKLKQAKGGTGITTFRYYIRINREPMTNEVCTKPCCSYMKGKDNDGTEV